jgi:hypothetical protein
LAQSLGSERSGARDGSARIFPRFRTRNQTFALGLLPSGLARAADGLCFLAVLALGRLFIRFTTLHLAKNAFALHLLFQDPESLIDIVIANKYLQMLSNRGAAASAAMPCYE